MVANSIDPSAARVVAVRLPDGDTEFWFTEFDFMVGQRLWCRGRPWVVAEIARTQETGTHPRVSLREPENQDAAAEAITPRAARLTAVASEPDASRVGAKSRRT